MACGQRGCFGRVLAAAGLAALSLSAGGCGGLGFFMDRVPLELAADVEVPDRCAVVFFVDNLRVSTLRRMLAHGHLPNIREFFVDGGVTVASAATTIPTITYAATTSMLTGQAPGRHGILGNQWFDRRTLDHRTYVSVRTYDRVNEDYAAANLFERLAAGGATSAVITCPNRRGARIVLQNVISGAVTYWHRNYEQIDWISAIRVAEIGQIVNAGSKRWPELILVYLPGCDEVMHEAGPDSRRYRHAIRNADFCIGEVCRALARNGLLERTYLALVSDHGGVEAERHTFDLVGWLEGVAGIPATAEVTWPQQSEEQRRAVFEGVSAVVVADAKRFATIHLRGPGGWAERPTSEQVRQAHRELGVMKAQTRSLPRLLAEDPHVDVVAYRGEGDRIHVLGARGEAVLSREGAPGAPAFACRYGYRILVGEDPLGIAVAGGPAEALADGRFHADRHWQLATAGTRRPDVVSQLAQLFDSPRSGQICLWAAEKCDFEAGSEGDHGGLTAAEIRVPMYFAGPGLPRGAAIPVGRTVDLAPTILGLLGGGAAAAAGGQTAAEDVIDGEDLSPQLRAASKAGT